MKANKSKNPPQKRAEVELYRGVKFVGGKFVSRMWMRRDAPLCLRDRVANLRWSPRKPIRPKEEEDSELLEQNRELALELLRAIFEGDSAPFHTVIDEIAKPNPHYPLEGLDFMLMDAVWRAAHVLGREPNLKEAWEELCKMEAVLRKRGEGLLSATIYEGRDGYWRQDKVAALFARHGWSLPPPPNLKRKTSAKRKK